MSDIWTVSLAALGQTASSIAFGRLVSAVGTVATVDEGPGQDVDATGATSYYGFIASGVECGFRAGVLSHVHVFLKPRDGYAAYSGRLPFSLSASTTEPDAIAVLGTPEAAGGGDGPTLFGQINPWALYTREGCTLRLEFGSDGKLELITFDTGAVVELDDLRVL